MKRSRWAAVAAAGLVAVSVVGGVVATSGSEETPPAGPAAATTTVAVERGELAASVSLNGTLTHAARPDGSPYAVVNRASGTYTALPAAGDRIGCGDVLYRVDDRPVLLLCGTIPAYRSLRSGDAGRDVRQLNRNLHRLGYDADPGDDDFGWRTEAALEQLQQDRGLDDATGELAAGDAVFLPRPIRVSKATGELGGPARPGARVVQGTSDRLVVQVQLDASQQGAVRVGDRAQIALPGNRSARGKVVRLGTIARAAAEQDAGVAGATLPAFVGIEEPKKARGLDAAPVAVEIATNGVRGVLSVPVLALVGSPGGGFAVELVRDGGRRELVAVRPGLFDGANARVEVEGDLSEGDRVAVPAP